MSWLEAGGTATYFFNDKVVVHIQATTSINGKTGYRNRLDCLARLKSYHDNV